MRRSGARAGDVLAVTGELGGAAAGLLLLERPELAVGARGRGGRGVCAAPARARSRGWPPGARSRTPARRAMIDLSDGLGADAGHLAGGERRSSCAIELERLPVQAGVAEVAAAAGLDAARARHGRRRGLRAARRAAARAAVEASAARLGRRPGSDRDRRGEARRRGRAQWVRRRCSAALGLRSASVAGESQTTALDQPQLGEDRVGDRAGVDVVPVECDLSLQLVQPSSALRCLLITGSIVLVSCHTAAITSQARSASADRPRSDLRPPRRSFEQPGALPVIVWGRAPRALDGGWARRCAAQRDSADERTADEAQRNRDGEARSDRRRPSAGRSRARRRRARARRRPRRAAATAGRQASAEAAATAPPRRRARAAPASSQTCAAGASSSAR